MKKVLILFMFGLAAYMIYDLVSGKNDIKPLPSSNNKEILKKNLVNLFETRTKQARELTSELASIKKAKGRHGAQDKSLDKRMDAVEKKLEDFNAQLDDIINYLEKLNSESKSESKNVFSKARAKKPEIFSSAETSSEQKIQNYFDNRADFIAKVNELFPEWEAKFSEHEKIALFTGAVHRLIECTEENVRVCLEKYNSGRFSLDEMEKHIQADCNNSGLKRSEFGDNEKAVVYSFKRFLRIYKMI